MFQIFETYEPVVEVDPERISKKIGVEISTAEMVKILESLKFEVTREGKSSALKYQVSVQQKM